MNRYTLMIGDEFFLTFGLTSRTDSGPVLFDTEKEAYAHLLKLSDLRENMISSYRDKINTMILLGENNNLVLAQMRALAQWQYYLLPSVVRVTFEKVKK